jgi:UDP-N-acetylmuramyl pentapeptide phosphotransferase/UDP-N-acetylglucosamine-1-phosphate transferase
LVYTTVRAGLGSKGMGGTAEFLDWRLGPLVMLTAAALSAGLIVLLRPYLARHALAQPNPRSSHRTPTPKGGGIAVIAATLGVTWGAVALTSAAAAIELRHLAAVTGATAFLALVAAVDDVRDISRTLRLTLQLVAVAIVIYALPADLHLVPHLPWTLERAFLFLAALWFVNVVNFMDGIDWMTVAEVVPVTGGLIILGLIGATPPPALLTALALFGAMLGFAPFNRPVARLFLGDVGSQPIGLLLGWMLILLAGRGHLAAAFLLPLYYLADATLTILRRIARGEPFWYPHRTHFYQRATDGGFSVQEIVVRVFILNLFLVALALVSVAEPDIRVDMAALSLGGALVAWQLITFARGKA